MYTTRRLSQLYRSPELVAEAPDGPNSGFLVIYDEEYVTYSCFGQCKDTTLNQLPFPQDRKINAHYSDESNESIFLIPLLNHPLSSNRYYAIVPHGKRKGQAWTCSRGYVDNLRPRPLDIGNIYQQMEIVPRRHSFYAKSIASDGFPPSFLRQKGWTADPWPSDDFNLNMAPGLDSALRARLPYLGSPASRMVGKWYTPFIFVKEGSLRDQVKNSMYYEVTLEQGWEQIFKIDDDNLHNHKGNSVRIDAKVEKEVVFVGGSKAAWDEGGAVDGVIWFKPITVGVGVGLRVELVERMKWEQERGGWMGREEGREVEIKKVVEFEGGNGGGWNEFVCYVLLERFNFKRMDGSLAMTYDFRHFHHLRTKWE